MKNDNYKAAYERQKLAREKAELLLETRSRDLYDSKSELEKAYEQLKNQQSQLLHQEKLASIGQLAAGIAHEINNPVGFIKSNLTSLGQYTVNIFEIISMYRLLFSRVSSGISDAELHEFHTEIKGIEEVYDLNYLLEDIPSLIDESLGGAGRIIKIVNGLKSFSRIDSDKKEVVDVNECIKNTIKLVENEIKFKANLIKRLGDIPKTMAYPGGLSQVILNLLVNASHAIEVFGEIDIHTSFDKNNIIIKIKDNGSGIDNETLKYIFNAFYTTKKVGVGTGLGLSISAGIIEQHNGKITVESEVGVGTCFSICIPVIAVEN